MTAKIWVARAIWFLGLLGIANVVLADATLRPGDQIEMKLAGVPATDTSSVSGIYKIDGGGAINLAYVGRVKIAGLTLGAAQSQSTIERAFKASEIYTHPNIVITMQAQSRFVNVGGEVKDPKRVPFTDDLTVLGPINAAGGSRLLQTNEKSGYFGAAMIIDVKKIRANPSLDLQLQPGDRVEVPQSLF